MANQIKSIEYKLGKSNSGKYQQLACDKNSDAFIKSLTMYGFGDCFEFLKKNNDGSLFGSHWGVGNLRYHRHYTRLIEMPKQDVERLASEISRTLFDNNSQKQKILEELVSLQENQSSLLKSGKIVFPEISAHELEYQESW